MLLADMPTSSGFGMRMKALLLRETGLIDAQAAGCNP